VTFNQLAYLHPPKALPVLLHLKSLFAFLLLSSILLTCNIEWFCWAGYFVKLQFIYLFILGNTLVTIVPLSLNHAVLELM